MVAQVIVAVADGDVKGHAPEQLLKIGSDVILGSARV